jgi:hypothetical protein
MSYLTGYSAYYNLYVPRTMPTTILGSSLGLPQKFYTVKGYVVESFTDSTTGYTWSFALTGGYNAPNLLPTPKSAMFSIPATAIGCTVIPGTYVQNVSTTMTIITPAGDSGGRTYQLIFYVTPGVQPTIQQTSGAAVATNLMVKSTDYIAAYP